MHKNDLFLAGRDVPWPSAVITGVIVAIAWALAVYALAFVVLSQFVPAHQTRHWAYLLHHGGPLAGGYGGARHTPRWLLAGTVVAVLLAAVQFVVPSTPLTRESLILLSLGGSVLAGVRRRIDR